MIRSLGSKVAWVGRTASMVFGLALVLALVFGAVSVGLAANGKPFILGKAANTASKVTGLVGNVDGGAALRVTNPNAGTNDTALDLRVEAGEAPMAVNSTTRVANLNADQLDDLDSASFQRSDAAAGGDLSGTYPDPQIAPNAVGGGLGGEIANNTVNADDIATGGVGSDEVENESLSIATDVQGGSIVFNSGFNNFPIPAHGCKLSLLSTIEDVDVGDLIVTEAVPRAPNTQSLPNGVYIPAHVVTKDSTLERVLCNGTSSEISLSGSFTFTFVVVR